MTTQIKSLEIGAKVKVVGGGYKIKQGQVVEIGIGKKAGLYLIRYGCRRAGKGRESPLFPP